MHPGLNIGIGSWIDAQFQTTAIPAFPAIAIPFELRHVSSLETPEDLARAAELALFANRAGATGSVYESGEAPNYLWELHQSNIRQMITAISTLSAGQQDELARVDAILYKADGLTLSDAHALYIETRQIYEDLVTQGASADDVQHAYTNWTTLGHKALIEEAIASKLSLSHTSSRVVGQNDVSKIEMALTSLGGDIPYAPTLFAPVSASSTMHWTEAEVDFQALEDAIRPQVSRTSWKQFRANRKGKVRFRFVGVDLFRPWFTTTIYEADDWRLGSGSDELVASGNGLSGTLPCYFSKLYMAQILDIRHENLKPPGPLRPTLALRPDKRLQKIATGARPELSGPQPASALQVSRSHRLARFSSLNSGDRRPGTARITDAVVSSRAAGKRGSRFSTGKEARRATLTASMIANTRPEVTLGGGSRIESGPHYRLGSAGRIAIVQKLDRISAANRIEFVLAHLATPSSPQPTESVDNTTYLVGFGRTNLPRCPDPNPNYQWP